MSNGKQLTLNMRRTRVTTFWLFASGCRYDDTVLYGLRRRGESAAPTVISPSVDHVTAEVSAIQREPAVMVFERLIVLPAGVAHDLALPEALRLHSEVKLAGDGAERLVAIRRRRRRRQAVGASQFVQLLGRPFSSVGDLQQERSASYACQLANCGRHMTCWQMLENIGGDDGIKGAIRERQSCGAGLLEARPDAVAALTAL